ncbi:filamentous hemagglutinin family N-terminal domain protein [Rivularia sp. PCC 7116]|uniref:two-partner secretion domain-containing protein n=1 Tax=Rivularia sp. PCC 7116 TaxID=373994 RepID=UPI00029F2E91|nr:filamentous hemagglutinin N-terminal domain-containing protein [Rivularia sp. PCC 7116]AFY57525.1 filamentous hemagglutinin family N-terminal domain protein [Rivularia sp. PCC 7116]
MQSNLKFWFLSLPLTTFLCFTGIKDKVSAQIIPDNTLGNDNSVVETITPQLQRIDGGVTRGANLFHSFQEFNIGEGNTAYFSNPATIQNIFTRVTGNNPSQIFGRLGVLGNANLYFFNPNGIIFGANTSLDIRGSFIASTASSLTFPESKKFSATNPEAPPLLVNNVSVPVGLQFEGIPGTITSTADLQTGQDLKLAAGNLDLQNQLQATGDLTLEAADTINIKGNLDASSRFNLGKGGDINLIAGGDIIVNPETSIVSRGKVGGDITLDSDGNISLTNSTIDNRSFNLIQEDTTPTGGNININADSVSINELSLLNTSTEGFANAGDVNINVNDLIEVNYSDIYTRVNADGVGNGGNINIAGDSVKIIDGSNLQSRSLGQGNSGNINITAKDEVKFAGIRSGFVSLATSEVINGAVGNAGDINITVSNGSLNIDDGNLLLTENSGDGSAGNVNINAKKSVALNDGTILARVEFAENNSLAIGNAGNINIETSNLQMKNAQLAISNDRRGNSGEVNIIADTLSLESSSINAGSTLENAGEVNIKARGSVSLTNSQIFTSALLGENKGGNIVIDAQSLVMTDNSTIGGSKRRQSETQNTAGSAGNINIKTNDFVTLDNNSNISASGFSGAGGNILIDTEKFSLQNGSQVTANVRGNQPAASLTINATESVEIIGFANFLNSQLSIDTNGIGDAGNLVINTGNLIIKDGGIVSSSAFVGKGGNLEINATESVEVIGTIRNGIDISSLKTDAGRADGGNLKINTPQLKVADGARVSALVNGSGNGGTININASESVQVIGTSKINDLIPSTITTGSNSISVEGNAGEINIVTPDLIVKDKANIAVNSQGRGIGGNIQLVTDNLNLDNGLIDATTRSTIGGNINVRADDIITMRRDSQISTTAGNEEFGGNGGNITINSPFIVAFPGNNQGNDITANAFTGNGGNINITTQALFGIEFRNQLTFFNDITASSEFGIDGSVNIDTLEIDPTRGLNQLPQETVNAEVSQNCQASRGGAKIQFYDVGTGGIPYSPNSLSNAEPFINENLIPLKPAPVSARKNQPQNNNISRKNSFINTLACQER